jgi:ankyrin repeat protein
MIGGDSCDREGNNCLYYAVLFKHHKLIKHIKEGDVAFRSNLMGLNPLMLACKKGYTECVRALLDKEKGFGHHVNID